MNDAQRKQVDFLGYNYALGKAMFDDDWDRYWLIHKEMRKNCWNFFERVAFRFGAIKVWLINGDKWKP